MPCDNHTLLHSEKSTLQFSDSVKHVQLCPIKNKQTVKLKGMEENNTVVTSHSYIGVDLYCKVPNCVYDSLKYYYPQ